MKTKVNINLVIDESLNTFIVDEKLLELIIFHKNVSEDDIKHRFKKRIDESDFEDLIKVAEDFIYERKLVEKIIKYKLINKTKPM